MPFIASLTLAALLAVQRGWAGPAPFAELRYDPAGRLQHVRRLGAGDLISSHRYDEAGRLLALEHWDLQDSTLRSAFQYGYDLAGNRIEERSLRVRRLRGATTDEEIYTFQFLTARYEYDALDRLTRVSLPNGRSNAYTYDAVGNRLTEHTVTPGQTITYTYNEDDQLLAASDGRRFAYDKNGRLLDEFRGGQLFRRCTYDLEDRLLRVEQGFDALTFSPFGLPAEIFRFTYDALGHRVSTEHNGELTRHLYRLDGPLPMLLYEQTSTDPKVHLWAGSTLLAEGTLDPATWSWPLFDALGTTTETVNSQGALTGIFHQDPWGLPTDTIDASALQGFALPTAASPGSVTHRFTGEPQLDGLGLVYLRARWYDPSLGRFLTRDPLEQVPPPQGQGSQRALFRSFWNPQTLHPYVYGGNNPLTVLDPLGLGFSDVVDRLVDRLGGDPGFASRFAESFQQNRLTNLPVVGPVIDFFSLYPVPRGLAVTAASELTARSLEQIAVKEAAKDFESFGRGNFVYVHGFKPGWLHAARVIRVVGGISSGLTVFSTAADIGTAIYSAIRSFHSSQCQ